MGFDSFIATVVSVAPDLVFKIQDQVRNGINEEARQLQNRITNLCTFINEESSYFVNQLYNTVITLT